MGAIKTFSDLPFENAFSQPRACCDRDKYNAISGTAHPADRLTELRPTTTSTSTSTRAYRAACGGHGAGPGRG
eukprot:2109113-Rhodomonas_salina.1